MPEEKPEAQSLPPKLDLGKGVRPASPEVVIKPAAPSEAPGTTRTIPKTPSITLASGAEPTLRIRPVSPQGDEQKTVLARKDVPGVPGAAQEFQKKDTSRIPLEAAKAMAGEVATEGATQVGLAPKTIRITGSAPETVQVQKPKPAAGLPSEEKRKTSRVALESAVSAPQEASVGPKTIKLKRPSDMGGKVAPTVVRPAVPPAEAASKTAQLEPVQDVGVASATATQKKTIKVRRPVSRTSIRPAVSAEVTPAQTGVAVGALQMAPEEPVERTGPVFPILAIAALLVMCVLVYLLSSQAFGPDVCLTPYSYAKNGPNLPWSGKTTFTGQ
jgi:hypothetical protein